MRQPVDVGEKSRTFQAYKSARRRVELVNWPGTDKPVGILYLHALESQASWFAAREHFDRMSQPFDDQASEQIDFEWQYQLVYLMLVDPETKNPTDRIFASVKELRANLTLNEVSYFIDKHEELRKGEFAEWTGESADRHVRQIGDVLGLGHDAKAEEIVDTIRAMVTRSEELSARG